MRKNQTHVGIPVEHMQNKIRHVSSTLSSPAEAEHSAAWLELIKLNAWVVRIDFPQKRVENETPGARQLVNHAFLLQSSLLRHLCCSLFVLCV